MRFGKSVWYANRIDQNNALEKTFYKPIEIKTRPNYFTVMPAVSRGYAEILKYGEKIENVWTVIANAQYFSGKFNVGDVFWVDDKKPLDNDFVDGNYGHSANAIVKNVAEINHTISITLYRNQL